MAVRCPHCSTMIEGAEGGSLPPWCPTCGKDFPKRAKPAVEPPPDIESLAHGSEAAEPKPTPPAPPPSIVCPHCAAPLDSHGDRPPPWCPTCGQDVASAVAAEPVARPAAEAKLAPLPKVPKPGVKEQPKITPLQMNSYVMGFVLIGWNFAAIMFAGPESADTILMQAKNLPKMVEYLQQAGVYLGIAYFFVSATQQSDKNLGKTLARVCAFAAIGIGIGYLGVFFDLLFNAEAGLPRAFFNRHFNLFIGLLDGAGVLYYLHKLER